MIARLKRRTNGEVNHTGTSEVLQPSLVGSAFAWTVAAVGLAIAVPGLVHAQDTDGGVSVEVYASPALGEGGAGNSFVIDVGEGVLIFDTQRLRPHVDQLLDVIGDRDVLAIFASHPHSDHYAGLAFLAERFPDAVRMSGPETRRAIAEDSNGFNAARRERHGDAFPSQEALTRAAPNRILEDGETLTFGSEAFEVVVFGLGHAEDHISLYHEDSRQLFAGDLVVNGYVPMSWGDIDAWLEQLEQLRTRFPEVETVHVGRGPSGDATSLFDAQIAYLTEVRRVVVTALEDDNTVDEAEKAQIVFDLELAHPHRIGAAGRDRRATLSTLTSRVAEQLGGSASEDVGSLPDRSTIAPSEDIGAVKTYASPALDVDTINAHLVTTPEGLIIIDAQRLSTDAERLVRLIGDRPVAAIVITHGHTDHYGGLPTLAAAFPDAPIYASATTAGGIREDRRGFNAMRRDRHGARFPTQQELTAAAPTQIVEDGATLLLGGTTFEAIVYGPSEAEDHLVLYQPDTNALFTGDLVNNGVIPVPFENLDAWLEQLDDLERRFPDAVTIYPGHGANGPAPSLIDGNRRYLLDMRDKMLAALDGDGVVTIEEKSTIVTELELSYPHHLGVAGFDRRALLSNVVDRLATQYGGVSEGAVDWNDSSRERGG
ncbi:MAG: MBL fold metallo-hydrolase [Pseudomonadota bacterium]